MFENISLWVPIIVLLLGAIGTFGVSVGTMIKLREEAKTLKADQKKVLHQVTNNSGTSMKDKVDSLVVSVDQVSNLTKRIDSEVSGIKKDVGRLTDMDVVDRQASINDKAETNKAFDKLHGYLSDFDKELAKIRDDLKKIDKKIVDHVESADKMFDDIWEKALITMDKKIKENNYEAK